MRFFEDLRRELRVQRVPGTVRDEMADDRIAHEREIADRIVDRIERVVWEIVPDLAEALIARELDRLKERAERRSPR